MLHCCNTFFVSWNVGYRRSLRNKSQISCRDRRPDCPYTTKFLTQIPFVFIGGVVRFFRREQAPALRVEIKILPCRDRRPDCPYTTKFPTKSHSFALTGLFVFAGSRNPPFHTGGNLSSFDKIRLFAQNFEENLL